MNAAIRCDALHKVYAGAAPVHALRGVSLEVRAGSVCVIAGPSGSGKTTLLSIAGALERATSGRVWVCGCDITAASSRALIAFRRAHLGYVFQDFKLIDVLTAEENVALPLELAGVGHGAALRRGGELLERLGLGARVGARPFQMSGGEQQRVAVARALIRAPQVVLADEPTANLDWAHGREIVELLVGAARERGTAVVVVSHDPRVAEHGDQTLQLADGVVVTGAARREVA